MTPILVGSDFVLVQTFSGRLVAATVGTSKRWVPTPIETGCGHALVVSIPLRDFVDNHRCRS
jgi:hypothetical protein